MPFLDVAPVALVAGTAQVLEFKSYGGIDDPVCSVKLQNESAFALRVDVGGDAHRIGAFMADVLPLRGQHFVEVTPSLIQAAAPASENQLFITLATAGDRIPGTYPAPLAREVVTNISSISGLTLAGWTVPGATRWRGFTGPLGLAIGTYLIDIPLLSNELAEAIVATPAIFTSGHAGVFAYTGRAVLYCLVGNLANGTCMFGLQDKAQLTAGNTSVLATTGNIVTSAALGAGATAVMRVAPGLAVAAGATANDIIGLAPRVRVDVGVAAQAFGFALDLM